MTVRRSPHEFRDQAGRDAADVVGAALTPMTDEEAQGLSVAVWDLWEAATRTTSGTDPAARLEQIGELFGRPYVAAAPAGFAPLLRVDGRDPITAGAYSGVFDLNGRYTAHMVDGARLVVPNLDTPVEKTGRKVLMRVRPEEPWSRVEFIPGRQFCMDAQHNRFVWRGETYPTFQEWLAAAGGKFTRGSVKYYHDESGTLRQAPKQTPVIAFDLASGQCLGLNIEAASTNLALQARNLTQAGVWTATSMTVARIDGVDGVDGAASTITATANNATISQSIAAPSSAYTFSFYLRRRFGRGPVKVSLDGGGTLMSVNAGDVRWKRVLVTGSVADPTILIQLGSSGDAIDVDFCQLEALPFQTSPILTTTAAVTRAADVCTIAVASDWYDTVSGTLAAEFMPWGVGLSVNPALVCFDDGTANNSIQLYYLDSATTPEDADKITGQITTAGAPQAQFPLDAFRAAGPGATNRVAMSWTTDEIIVRGEGRAGPPAAMTSVTPSKIKTLRLGVGPGGAPAFSGYLKTLMYWNLAVPQSQIRLVSAKRGDIDSFILSKSIVDETITETFGVQLVRPSYTSALPRVRGQMPGNEQDLGDTVSSYALDISFQAAGQVATGGVEIAKRQWTGGDYYGILAPGREVWIEFEFLEHDLICRLNGAELMRSKMAGDRSTFLWDWPTSSSLPLVIGAGAPASTSAAVYAQASHDFVFLAIYDSSDPDDMLRWMDWHERRHAGQIMSSNVTPAPAPYDRVFPTPAVRGRVPTLEKVCAGPDGTGLTIDYIDTLDNGAHGALNITNKKSRAFFALRGGVYNPTTKGILSRVVPYMLLNGCLTQDNFTVFGSSFTFTYDGSTQAAQYAYVQDVEFCHLGYDPASGRIMAPNIAYPDKWGGAGWHDQNSLYVLGPQASKASPDLVNVLHDLAFYRCLMRQSSHLEFLTWRDVTDVTAELCVFMDHCMNSPDDQNNRHPYLAYSGGGTDRAHFVNCCFYGGFDRMARMNGGESSAVELGDNPYRVIRSLQQGCEIIPSSDQAALPLPILSDRSLIRIGADSDGPTPRHLGSWTGIVNNIVTGSVGPDTPLISFMSYPEIDNTTRAYAEGNDAGGRPLYGPFPASAFGPTVGNPHYWEPGVSAPFGTTDEELGYVRANAGPKPWRRDVDAAGRMTAWQEGTALSRVLPNVVTDGKGTGADSVSWDAAAWRATATSGYLAGTPYASEIATIPNKRSTRVKTAVETALLADPSVGALTWGKKYAPDVVMRMNMRAEQISRQLMASDYD
jgi:hypothetical protein